MTVPSEPELGVGPEAGKVRHMCRIIPQCSNSIAAVKALQKGSLSSHTCSATGDESQFSYFTELWVSFAVCMTPPLLQKEGSVFHQCQRLFLRIFSDSVSYHLKNNLIFFLNNNLFSLSVFFSDMFQIHLFPLSSYFPLILTITCIDCSVLVVPRSPWRCINYFPQERHYCFQEEKKIGKKDVSPLYF